MNIVFYSPNFHPMIGGVENIVKGMATELTAVGHSVRVLTLARPDEPDRFPFRVVRGATSLKSVSHIRWADVVVHVNISLKGILPLLLTPRPLVVYHNGFYDRNTVSGRLKWLVTNRMAINVGCSSYISAIFKCRETIPNPYKDALFRPIADVTRNRELLFLGRLVSQKGCDILLKALHQLKRVHALQPSLTIVGDGPEKPALTALTTRLGLTDQVTFDGARTGDELARCLNRHQIVVVPSTYNEPFGAVGVEGIACGCFVISSDGGGLPDTLGQCGVTFPMGDYVALAGQLQRALSDPTWRAAHQQHAGEHLSRHTLRAVTNRFLQVFTSATGVR